MEPRVLSMLGEHYNNSGGFFIQKDMIYCVTEEEK